MKSVEKIVAAEALAAIGAEIMAFAICKASDYEEKESNDRLMRAMARSWLHNITVQAALGYSRDEMNKIIEEEMQKMSESRGGSGDEPRKVREEDKPNGK